MVIQSEVLNVVHIPCSRLFIQYLVQQIAQAAINHLSLVSKYVEGI